MPLWLWLWLDPSGSYNYNSIKICKQISTPSHPYQKIPDIYFLRSCSLPNFITIPSPITIQFVDVFVLYVILYLLLYCLLCYLVLRPQSWINSTTATTTCMPSFILIHLTVWPHTPTSQTDRKDRTTVLQHTANHSIRRTVLQTVAQKTMPITSTKIHIMYTNTHKNTHKNKRSIAAFAI